MWEGGLHASPTLRDHCCRTACRHCGRGRRSPRSTDAGHWHHLDSATERDEKFSGWTAAVSKQASAVPNKIAALSNGGGFCSLLNRSDQNGGLPVSAAGGASILGGALVLRGKVEQVPAPILVRLALGFLPQLVGALATTIRAGLIGGLYCSFKKLGSPLRLFPAAYDPSAAATQHRNMFLTLCYRRSSPHITQLARSIGRVAWTTRTRTA